MWRLNLTYRACRMFFLFQECNMLLWRMYFCCFRLHSLTRPLTHSLTPSLPYSLTHSLTHSPTHSLPHSPTPPLTHSFTPPLPHSPTHSLPRFPTHPLTHSPTHSLTHSPTPPLPLLFTHAHTHYPPLLLTHSLLSLSSSPQGEAFPEIAKNPQMVSSCFGGHCSVMLCTILQINSHLLLSHSLHVILHTLYITDQWTTTPCNTCIMYVQYMYMDTCITYVYTYVHYVYTPTCIMYLYTCTCVHMLHVLLFLPFSMFSCAHTLLESL